MVSDFVIIIVKMRTTKSLIATPPHLRLIKFSCMSKNTSSFVLKSTSPHFLQQKRSHLTFSPTFLMFAITFAVSFLLKDFEISPPIHTNSQLNTIFEPTPLPPPAPATLKQQSKAKDFLMKSSNSAKVIVNSTFWLKKC